MVFVLGLVVSLHAQNVGIGTTNPDFKLDTRGYSASTNQVSIIPLWQAGSAYVMNNTSGQDLSNCEAGFEPSVYDDSGHVDVKLIVRITGTSAGTNNFQLRAHDGTNEDYPIDNNGWTFASTETGLIATSPWKYWNAGTNAFEIHLFGWVSGGSTDFNSAYLLVRPHQP